jgi:D-3-phosphoglycerate dehydrogenase / 2-oxoglutarate reductase
MDILIVEPIEDDIVRWLEARHTVCYEPEMARDPRAFRQSLYNVRSLILPPSLSLDAQTLHSAPVLRAVGRVSAGAENIDIDACAKAGVEVVRSSTATAQAEAEFVIGAMLSLLRRVPVKGSDGMRVGRELGGAQVGLIGMTPAARALNRLLVSFGARVSGYDPSLHASDGVWERWNVKPLGLRELLETSDVVSVQLAYFSRYHGLLGERFLPFCKIDQVIVSISHSALFDELALAKVMQSHRVAAAWFDSLEPGLLDEGRPLADLTSLQVTPRVASTTRESRLRSAWAVAQRLDELLSLPGVPGFEVQRPTSAPANSRIASAAFMGLSALPEMTEIDDTPQAAAMFDENGTMLQGDAYVEADEAAVDELQRAYENAGHGASQAAPVASASPALSSALHEFEPPAEAPSREFKASTEALSREFKASTEALEADFATGPVLP